MDKLFLQLLISTAAAVLAALIIDRIKTQPENGNAD